MMKFKVLMLASLLTFCSMPPARAAYEPCYLDGRWYEHGTRIGSYICQHGQWLPI
ncbi:hypothetical protein H6G17_24470 [Chroococcidiopsis sp. FACHB-1243]|uniref:hypothetical protein n=1 Tax=Chroococcidiopsis sp. [FACHB-1243] TaxID=2692781 RepID=UPI001786D4A4|nr:hypothetical protein [Chroococcidiopsis sp. [FACHB-1243]]MBD2308630.1 hypothetical protein [Chroococcidiopsis sp. [FACHB-1243]]